RNFDFRLPRGQAEHRARHLAPDLCTKKTLIKQGLFYVHEPCRATLQKSLSIGWNVGWPGIARSWSWADRLYSAICRSGLHHRNLRQFPRARTYSLRSGSREVKKTTNSDTVVRH